MRVRLDQRGLVPAVIQDFNTKEILMLGYLSQASMKLTMEHGQVWFYSRSRENLWHKGESSGNYFNLRKAWVDCDEDTVLLQVEPDGPACHTGNTTCFFNALDAEPDFHILENGSGVLEEIFRIIEQRKEDMPADSYTASLLKSGVGRVAQKVVEEAGESAIAAVEGVSERLTSEVADLFYHAMVLLAATGTSPDDVWRELRLRMKG